MLNILTTGHPVLVSKAEPVKKFDKKLHETIEGMKETLIATTDPVGVGLAAPQVGIPLRFFIARIDEKSEIKTFVNPEILEKFEAEEKQKKTKSKKKKDKTLLEGCLSIPNIWGNVKRANKIKISFQDETGQELKEEISGFMATVVQHEVDHLDGILFTKHALEQNEKLYKSYKNEKGEDEFEEIKI